MSNGIEIKNLPSATTIKQNDTMTIVQDRENKQLTLDRFANESDLTTLTPLEARCDEVKAKIEVDEYSAEITTSQSMSEIGSDDSGANLHENVLDGAFELCVLKGKTKYIDNDTQEILDLYSLDSMDADISVSNYMGDWDTTHPNGNGQQVIADYMVQQMLN